MWSMFKAMWWMSTVKQTNALKLFGWLRWFPTKFGYLQLNQDSADYKLHFLPLCIPVSRHLTAFIYLVWELTVFWWNVHISVQTRWKDVTDLSKASQRMQVSVCDFPACIINDSGQCSFLLGIPSILYYPIHRKSPRQVPTRKLNFPKVVFCAYLSQVRCEYGLKITTLTVEWVTRREDSIH